MKKTTFLVLRIALMVTLVLLLVSCRKKETAAPMPLLDAPPENLTEQEQQTYHTDTSYKYEYRTGISGEYQYNYDVSGTDDNGEEITGNVSMQHKYGSGTITNADGEEVDVEVEWVDYGKLRATDTDGNEYELEAD